MFACTYVFAALRLDDNENDIYKLRELFYDRNPGDARVKVGSERKVATSPARPNYGDVEIGVNHMGFCPRDPSKIGPVIGEFTPIKSPILRWDFLRITDRCCVCQHLGAKSVKNIE